MSYDHKCPVQGCMIPIAPHAPLCDRHWHMLDVDKKRRFAAYARDMNRFALADITDIAEQEPCVAKEARWAERLLQHLAHADLLVAQGRGMMRWEGV